MTKDQRMQYNNYKRIIIDTINYSEQEDTSQEKVTSESQENHTENSVSF